MSDCSELLAEYHYGDGRIIRVYACYESAHDMDKRRASFWDCYDADGACVNEGDPWYGMPTWAQCLRYYVKGAEVANGDR